MTLWLWRKGTATKEALPYHTVGDGKRANVRFGLGDTRRWAKKHGIEFAVDPSTLVGGDAPRPGPVTRKASKAGKPKH